MEPEILNERPHLPITDLPPRLRRVFDTIASQTIYWSFGILAAGSSYVFGKESLKGASQQMPLNGFTTISVGFGVAAVALLVASIKNVNFFGEPSKPENALAVHAAKDATP